MKKVKMTIVALALAVTGAKAQYADVWGNAWDPGSLAWCWQQQLNIISMQNAMMQQQILNYYRQQAQNVTNWINNNPFNPYPGQVITRDGITVSYELVNSTSSSGSGQCSNCNGAGFLNERYYMGNNQIKTIRRRCGVCHGTGRAR